MGSRSFRFLGLAAAGLFFTCRSILFGPVVGDELLQSARDFGVGRIVDQVALLLGILGVVVKLRSLLPAVPLGVAILLGPYTMAGELAAPDLREGRFVPGSLRIVQQRPKALARKLSRRREPAQVGQCRIQIHEFYRAAGDASFGLLSRH